MNNNRVFECANCGTQWEVEPCTQGGKHGYEIACPKCGSYEKIKIAADGARHQCGGGMEHHHQNGHCGCGK